MILTVGMCVCVGALFFLTLDLEPAARLVPLTVVVPTLVLLLIQLVLDIFPRLGQVYESRENSGLSGLARMKRESVPPSSQSSVLGRAWAAFIWVLLLPAFVYIAGFLVAVPLFTTLYFRIRARVSWRASFIASAASWVLLYSVFVTALGARLYEGILWSWLGG